MKEWSALCTHLLDVVAQSLQHRQSTPFSAFV